MSLLVQNQNQFAQTAMLGQVTMDPQPSTIPAQIYSGSTAVIGAGTAVKLVDVAGPNVVVDATTSATDGPVFGVIPFNLRKNTYAALDAVEVCARGSILMLKSSASIARGTNVSCTNAATAADDPVVQTTTSAGDYILGVCLGHAAAANALVKVLVAPGYITASTAATVGETA